jgi:hypothetical protein
MGHGSNHPARRRAMSAIVGLTVLVVGCAQAASSDPEASRIAAVSALRSIVLAPDAPPAGMHHDATAEGAEVLTRTVMSEQVADLVPTLAQPGFVAGRYTEFSGDAGALLSWAAMFDSVESAKGAYALYLVEFASDDAYGFSPTQKAGLGDEGACDEGDVVLDRATGATLRESICLWRADDLVLAAGGPIAAADLRLIAEAMDARVGKR